MKVLRVLITEGTKKIVGEEIGILILETLNNSLLTEITGINLVLLS